MSFQIALMIVTEPVGGQMLGSVLGGRWSDHILVRLQKKGIKVTAEVMHFDIVFAPLHDH